MLILTCAFMGETQHALGEVLFLAATDDLRKRVASVLSASAKTGVHHELRAFQDAGGEVDILFAALDELHDDLEAALLQEHLHRAGVRPAWNRAVPKTKVSPAAMAAAEKILDALRVGPR